MKINTVLFYVALAVLSACQSGSDGKLTLSTKQLQLRAFLNLTRAHRHVNDGKEMVLVKADGLHPVTYFGDTIAYQYYKDGIAHGPYYTAENYQYKKEKNTLPDGYYKNGKKHGYFYRYSSPNQLDYMAYYVNDKMRWADIVDNNGYPKLPYFLGKKSVKITAKRPDGQIWFNGEFKNGLPYGKHYYYNYREQLVKVVDWEDSLLFQHIYLRDTFQIKETPFHGRCH